MTQYSTSTNEFLTTNRSIYEVVIPADSYGNKSDGIGGTLLDSFGRIRVSDPHTLFDNFSRYSFNNVSWDVANTSNSTVTFNEYQGCIDMVIDTTAGTEIIRETKRVFPYQPGKSLLIMSSLNFAQPKANLQQRIGYFSSNNGIFLEQTDLTTYIVLRSIGTGTVIDTKVPQSEWNVDKFDGTGPSGVTLDISKSQILWQDLEWLGVGRVRVGFILGGKLHIAHVFNNGNSGLGTYMQTACLPVRFEIRNLSNTSNNSTMKQICSSVVSEGGYTQVTTTKSISNPITGKNLTQSIKNPLISLRLRSGRTDAIVLPVDFELYGIQDVAYKYYIIQDVSSLTGESWTTLDGSSVEYDLSATALTGGRIINEGVFHGHETFRVNLRELYRYSIQLARKINAVNGEIFCIAAEPTTTNDKIVGSITWQEQTI